MLMEARGQQCGMKRDEYKSLLLYDLVIDHGVRGQEGLD
jgi:hypothetical protein